MQRRRERILAEARAILAEQGFEALNLRDLADISEVTVPTIYNLIGNKEQVLQALMLGAFGDFEEELEQRLPCPAIELAELMGDTLQSLLARDEAFYRASALANERLESQPSQHGNSGIRRETLRRYMGYLCQVLLDDGLLKGQVSQELLVEQMVSLHQVAFRDWAHRLIDLREFRRTSLQGFYVTLAADATEEYHRQLIEALNQL
jgi:AcrR family transcriptional regulator